MTQAFVSSLPLSAFRGTHVHGRTPASVQRKVRVRVSSVRMTQTETDAEKSSAQRTRDALSSRKSKVKFRKELSEEPDEFVYTSGVDSGVDIWLIGTVLAVLVPVVVLFVAVSTGYVDLTPR